MATGGDQNQRIGRAVDDEAPRGDVPERFCAIAVGDDGRVVADNAVRSGGALDGAFRELRDAAFVGVEWPLPRRARRGRGAPLRGSGLTAHHELVIIRGRPIQP